MTDETSLFLKIDHIVYYCRLIRTLKQICHDMSTVQSVAQPIATDLGVMKNII